MGNNQTDACDVNSEKKVEKEQLNLIIIFNILFFIPCSNQEECRQKFRSKSSEKVSSQSLGDDLEEADFKYDSEEAEKEGSVIKLFKYSVNESSPKAQKELSKKIDDVIKSLCRDDSYKCIRIQIYIPSFTNILTVAKWFFSCLTPECLSVYGKVQNESWYKKIQKAGCWIYFYVLDNIKIKFTTTQKDLSLAGDSFKINPYLVKASALMSHYTYFYLNYLELKKWPILRNSDFEKLLDVVLEEKFDSISNVSQSNVTKSTQNSLGDKERGTIYSIWNFTYGIYSGLVESGKKVLNFCYEVVDLLIGINYEERLQRRLLNSIIEVLDIVCSNKKKSALEKKEEYKHTIKKILIECEKNGHGLDLYDFYDKCGFWDYIGDERIRRYCRKWQIVHPYDVLSKYYPPHERTEKKIKYAVKVNGKTEFITDYLKSGMGFISGFGAMLFTNIEEKNQYIFCTKGTDFDSIVRDWIFTNLMQGLIGVSAQHVHSVVDAKLLDEAIGAKGGLLFVGHSLGGGLASANAISTKTRKAVTFNAAGLNVIGVKLNQLFNNPNAILNPSQSWNRVYPFRVHGEALDFLQNTLLRVLTFCTLERAYGKQVSEYDLPEYGVGLQQNKLSSDERKTRHGMVNFLKKEVFSRLGENVLVNSEKNIKKNVSVFIKGKDFIANVDL